MHEVIHEPFQETRLAPYFKKFLIPLSYVNPRGGRATNIVAAILVYLVYSNFLGVSQAWVAQGKIGVGGGILVVHGLMLAATMLLFLRREAPMSLWRMLRRS